MLFRSEQDAILRAILPDAPDPQSFVDRMFLMPDTASLALGFLPEEKWRRSLQALAISGLRTREVEASPDDGGDFHLRESKRIERRMAVLKDVLTPAELKEYGRRASNWMQVMFYEFAYFEGTEAEFDKLATLDRKSTRLNSSH